MDELRITRIGTDRNFSGKGSSLAFWHGCKNARHDPDGANAPSRLDIHEVQDGVAYFAAAESFVVTGQGVGFAAWLPAHVLEAEDMVIEVGKHAAHSDFGRPGSYPGCTGLQVCRKVDVVDQTLGVLLSRLFGDKPKGDGPSCLVF